MHSMKKRVFEFTCQWADHAEHETRPESHHSRKGASMRKVYDFLYLTLCS